MKSRKLITLIPTGEKTKEEIIKSIDLLWPEIQKKIYADKQSKKSLFHRVKAFFFYQVGRLP